KIFVDCDVDAADLFLIMNPNKKETHQFSSGNKANIDLKKCVQCGLCKNHCRFSAISSQFRIDHIKCVGCGVCQFVCSSDAVSLEKNIGGEWYVSDTRFGELVHAKLGVAEDNSGKLVSIIRNKASEIAKGKNIDLIVVDGPPGIGCPVISSLTGCTDILVVVEPTVSGVHDMERVIKLATKFKLRTMVCINKFDLNQDMVNEVDLYCKQKNIKIVGKIPYSSVFNRAQNVGKNIFEYISSIEGTNEDTRDSQELAEIIFNMNEVIREQVFKEI
ncbi:MAG: 4Fe-4S binding protein, partial [Oligoflexia bacterium]|nr:4Fe-4S binding protein [Oligoflexia bacterium]